MTGAPPGIDPRLIYESQPEPPPPRGAELLLLIIVLATLAPFLAAWMSTGP